MARYMYSYRTVTSRFGAWGLMTNTGNSPPIQKGAPAVMQHCLITPAEEQWTRKQSLLDSDHHSCKVRVLYTTLGFFFCKVAGKNPWARVAVFWAYFKRYGCLLGKSDKQLRFFIYVRRILQCIDWHCLLAGNSQPVQ